MRTGLLALALSTAAISAQATPVTFDARVLATTGPLAGEKLFFHFTFDDTVLVDGIGTSVPVLTYRGSGDFAGLSVSIPYVELSGRTLGAFVIGASASGFDELDGNPADNDFLIDNNGFGYALTGEPFIFSGVLEYAAVPTPAALTLFGAGLATLALRRRRAA